MAQYKRLSAEELQLEMTKKRTKPSPRTLERQRALQEMIDYLSGIKPGEGGEIVLEEGDNRMRIKNLLKKAADQLGVELEFIRRRKRIVFRVVEKGEETAPEEG